MESIKEAKTICAHSIQDAENCCSIAIREAESEGPPRLAPFNSHHQKVVQCLEEESIKEERKGQLNFISICQITLQTSPSEFHGTLVAYYQILLIHAPMSHLFSIPQGASPFPSGSAPGTSSPPMPKHSPRAKWWHHYPDPMVALPLGRTTPKATPEGPSISKWQEIIPLHKALTGNYQEAFSQDSRLVKEMREEYFQSHCPNFNNENTCVLMDVFWHMIKTTDLLGSAIYKITEARSG